MCYVLTDTVSCQIRERELKKRKVLVKKIEAKENKNDTREKYTRHMRKSKEAKINDMEETD